MKKLFLLLLTISSYADDLDLGDDFVAGEVVKAADFNTKFSLIEGQEAELTNSKSLEHGLARIFNKWLS